MAIEHLMRCSIAKALPGRVIEPPADGIEIAGCNPVDIGFAWQIPADATIGVFVGSFLPRRAGIGVYSSNSTKTHEFQEHELMCCAIAFIAPFAISNRFIASSISKNILWTSGLRWSWRT